MTTVNLNSGLIGFENALLTLSDTVNVGSSQLAQGWGGPYSFKQISSNQVVVSTEGGHGLLVIDGSGMEVPIGSVLSGTVPAITPNNISGTVTAVDLYQGGSLQGSTVTGGSLSLAATFSATQWQITSDGLQLTLVGSQLPTSASIIDSVIFGSYAAATINFSSLTLADTGKFSLVYTPGASTLTLTTGDYKEVLSGTNLPSSLTAAQIDQIALGEVPTLPGSFNSLSITQISTGNAVLGQTALSAPISLQNLLHSGAQDFAAVSAVMGVSDSAADIMNNLGTLQSFAAAGVLSSITLTDSGIPTLNISPTELTADAAILHAIQGYFQVSISASAPNLYINGVAGHGNTVVFVGNSSQYSIVTPGNGQSLTVTDVGTGRSSVDYLNGVTALQFANTIDIVAHAPGTNGVVTTGNVTELYGAVFGRLPDVPGLAYYLNELNTNPQLSLVTLATDFLTSPEYTGNSAHNYAQSSAGDAQFITDSYTNLLHRGPASGDVAWYQANVINPILGNLTPGTAAYTQAELVAHAVLLVDFSASAEFLTDVKVTAQTPSSPGFTGHWLLLN